ncbi:MAG: sigma D regulator [Marinobacter sp.]
MLDNCRNAKERWGGVHQLIDRWLKERQELLVQYCELSDSARNTPSEDLGRKLERLCQVLVDYTSAGHFEVYDQLIEEAREFDDGGVELASRLYPRISATTEVVLDFNERIDGKRPAESEMDDLMAELSRLGEVLETRFELEDFLIEHLHNAHADQVPSSA